MSWHQPPLGGYFSPDHSAPPPIQNLRNLRDAGEYHHSLYSPNTDILASPPQSDNASIQSWTPTSSVIGSHTSQSHNHHNNHHHNHHQYQRSVCDPLSPYSNLGSSIAGSSVSSTGTKKNTRSSRAGKTNKQTSPQEEPISPESLALLDPLARPETVALVIDYKNVLSQSHDGPLPLSHDPALKGPDLEKLKAVTDKWTLRYDEMTDKERVEHNSKRAPNSFIIYRSIMAATAKARLTEWASAEDNSEAFGATKATQNWPPNPIVCKLCGESWNIEYPAVKEIFEQAAVDMRHKHQQWFPNYQYAPGKKKRGGRKGGDANSVPVSAPDPHTYQWGITGQYRQDERYSSSPAMEVPPYSDGSIMFPSYGYPPASGPGGTTMFGPGHFVSSASSSSLYPPCPSSSSAASSSYPQGSEPGMFTSMPQSTLPTGTSGMESFPYVPAPSAPSPDSYHYAEGVGNYRPDTPSHLHSQIPPPSTLPPIDGMGTSGSLYDSSPGPTHPVSSPPVSGPLGQAPAALPWINSYQW